MFIPFVSDTANCIKGIGLRQNAFSKVAYSTSHHPAGLPLRSLLSTVHAAPCLCSLITISQLHSVNTKHTGRSFPTLLIEEFSRSAQPVSSLLGFLYRRLHVSGCHSSRFFWDSSRFMVCKRVCPGVLQNSFQEAKYLGVFHVMKTLLP
jgi:hypothetical protein